MIPVPIPPEIVPDDIPTKVIVVGPPPSESILDDDAPMPVEALVMPAPKGAAYCVRLALEEGDLDALALNPFLWFVCYSAQLPVFEIKTDKEMREP